ncbi:hypothetical protein HK44_003965 [Pseudomonas fluorescens HK44]|uniref:Uncharacterized protein n=1 Tax=Pseudomonas fluorescens HK44 TaxID=1042209 RepID=A0A010SM80_PSEFL|nr:hypothetical protein HK44_003965 [Pseudomonas fluorescens HK44]
MFLGRFKSKKGEIPRQATGFCFKPSEYCGARIFWLPKRFGHFSIEILEDKALEAFVETAYA